MTIENLQSSDTLIIGYGVTGKATAFALGIRNYSDKGDEPTLHFYNSFILCLPTPTIKGKQDISAIEEWLEKIKNGNSESLVIIRSTILPGTTEKLIKKYDLNIVFVPEFLTESTAVEDAVNPEFMVIGTKDPFLRQEVRDLFKINTKE